MTSPVYEAKVAPELAATHLEDWDTAQAVVGRLMGDVIGVLASRAEADDIERPEHDWRQSRDQGRNSLNSRA